MLFLFKKHKLACASLAASAFVVLGLTACGKSRDSRVSDTSVGSESSNLSTDMLERDCPETIRMKWNVDEVKPLISLRDNAEYKKALRGLENLKQGSEDLQFKRVSLRDKQCVYNEKNNALAAKVFVKKVIEEQFVEDQPRFAVLTRMTVRVEDSSTSTRFLSFFTIGTLPSGETVVENENDDIKQVLTPVGDKLRSVGSIRYAFEFARVQ